MEKRLKTAFGLLTRDQFAKEAEKRIHVARLHAQALFALLEVLAAFEGKPVSKRIATALAQRLKAYTIDADADYLTAWGKEIFIGALTPEGRRDLIDKNGVRIQLCAEADGTLAYSSVCEQIRDIIKSNQQTELTLNDAVKNFDSYAAMTDNIVRAVGEYTEKVPIVLRHNSISSMYIS